MHNKFYRCFSLNSCIHATLIVFFCFATILGQDRTSVRVSPDTTIENDRVNLGSISRISGGPERSERLRSISLGYAPNVGMTREISRIQILLAISASGFSEKEVSLNTPAKILVRRAGQNISQDQIRKTIEKVISDQFSSDKVSAAIIRLDVPDKIQVPSGILEIRANAASVRNLFARFTVPVEIRIDNIAVRNFAATVEIEAYADVLVAAKDLAANSKIGELDVRVEKRRLMKALSAYLLETEKIRSAVLIREVRSGSEIMTDSLVAGVAVRYGDSVRVETQSGNLKIIVKGEARASGKIGDRIAVKNSQSGAILQAVVLDEGLVKVTF